VILDIIDEESDKEVEELEIIELEQGKIITKESEEGDIMHEEILQIIHEEDGMKKISNIWSIRPSYE
jgi:hypothetical protein